MDVSIVMPTRDRGRAIIPAVEAVLRDQSCAWEVIIVDQSASDAAEQALCEAGLLANARLTYRRSSTKSVSAGRNEGCALARGAVIACTDDDCIVPPGWAGHMAQPFAAMPELALLYAPVVAPLEDSSGWIPEFRPLREGFVDCVPSTVIRQLGFTANCAFRRSVLATIGPFDTLLGAGTPGSSGADTDFGYRTLRRGLKVYTTQYPSVTHYGRRTGRDASILRLRYLGGDGDNEHEACPLWRYRHADPHPATDVGLRA